MATVDKVWNFPSDTMGLADVGDSAITVTWDSGAGAVSGNGSLEFVGAATGVTERARRASTGETWETWGVPAGATVNSIQIQQAYKRRWDGSAPTAALAMRVVDSAGSTVHSAGDILTVAAATGADGSWVAQGVGTSRAVDSGKQASTTDVRLEVQITSSVPNSTLDFGVDAITLRIDYTAGGTPATVTAVPASSAGSAPAASATATAGTDTLGYANGTLGAPWQAWFDAMPTITSGVARASATLKAASYAVVTDSADSLCEAIFDATMGTGISYDQGVGIRLSAHSSSATGYSFQVQGGTNIVGVLHRENDFTVLATSGNYTSVEGIRITAVGSTIKGYFRISGVWTEVVSATDATYSAAGYPGFWVDAVGGTPIGITQVTWGAAAGGTDATVTAVVAASAGSAPVAAITAGATVTAVVADSVGTAPPANNLISVVVGAPASVSLGSAPVASVSAGGTGATVTAVPATSAGSAPVAGVSAGVAVSAVVADSVGSAPVAALAAGVTVAAVPAVSSGQAPRPTITPSPTGGGVSGDVAATFAEASS